MMRSRGFSLIDLLVLVIAALLAAAWYVPTLHRFRHYSGPLTCASNLKRIGQAMVQYANENRGQFPRTRWDPHDPQVRAYTNPSARNPFAEDGPLPNDVTASLYLLVRGGMLTPDVLICPLTSPTPLLPHERENWQKAANFPGPHALGYSMANPFPGSEAVVQGFAWSAGLGIDYPILADMNPGVVAMDVTPESSKEQLSRANSRNHAGTGQNVLYGDGRVEVVTTPFAGINGDNIYTSGPVGSKAGGIGGMGLATSASDAILLPIALVDVDGRPNPFIGESKRNARITTVWYSLIFAALALAVVWVWRSPFVRRTMGQAGP